MAATTVTLQRSGSNRYSGQAQERDELKVGIFSRELNLNRINILHSFPVDLITRFTYVALLELTIYNYFSIFFLAESQ